METYGRVTVEKPIADVSATEAQTQATAKKTSTEYAKAANTSARTDVNTAAMKTALGVSRWNKCE